MITSMPPGQEQAGEELVTDELLVPDGPLNFDDRGACGSGSRLDRAG